MAIQITLTNDGKISAVKMIKSEPRVRRSRVRQHNFAKYPMSPTCQYCNKKLLSPSASSMLKHQKSKNCQKAQSLMNRMEIDT